MRKREAAVIKRIEVGLASASLRRTYDEVTVRPVGLSVLIQELIRRESRDDPAKYKTYMTQEKEKENTTKPKNPPTANVVRLQDVLDAKGSSPTSAEVNVANQSQGKGNTAKGAKRNRVRNNRAQQTGATAGDKEEGPGQGRRSNWRPPLKCWKCGMEGHMRWTCQKATPEDVAAWREDARQYQDSLQSSEGGATGKRPRGNAKSIPEKPGGGGADQPAQNQPPTEN
jgi:hypothetical protein